MSASFIWLVTKRLLRPVNLEMVQFVDLRKCYAQTVFTFWMTLVVSQANDHSTWYDIPEDRTLRSFPYYSEVVKQTSQGVETQYIFISCRPSVENPPYILQC
jgi:hypothetical protein